MPISVTYVMVLERIPGREFRVHFPDFPEVRASGATIEDAGTRGSRALRAHIEELLQSEGGVPRPTPVADVKEDGRYRNGFLLKIDVEVPESSLRTRNRRPDAPLPETAPAVHPTREFPE